MSPNTRKELRENERKRESYVSELTKFYDILQENSSRVTGKLTEFLA